MGERLYIKCPNCKVMGAVIKHSYYIRREWVSFKHCHLLSGGCNHVYDKHIERGEEK